MAQEVNKIERAKAVKAMEFMARNLNDEAIVNIWLTEGVADGEIDYGDLDVGEDDVENLEYYIEDEAFADLMDTFVYCMAKARKSGGLYCDGIVSKPA